MRSFEVLDSQREQQEQQLFGLDDDYFLPINHRAADTLDTSNMVVATVDTPITCDNKGYQMLQRMGWGGEGLGRKEDGVDHAPTSLHASLQSIIIAIVH